jgi:hypothetical protein
MDSGDLLHNIKFVKLVSVSDLPYAEAIQKALRERGIGAVIINDERVQARPEEERAQAVPPPEGFRLEIPEILIEKARQVLSELQKDEEEA